MEFNKYFKEEYQFTLKKAVYSRVESEPQDTEVTLNVDDNVDTSVKDETLEVNFKRKVFFNPEALYSLEVAFSLELSFRSRELMDETKDIDWCEALTKNDNPYMGNIVSRASYLIAALTSSYGQQPLVTPPGMIHK